MEQSVEHESNDNGKDNDNEDRSHDPFCATGLPRGENIESALTTSHNRPDIPLLPALGVSSRTATVAPNPSPAEREWERRKTEYGGKSRALDQLMSMVGLEEVKREFLAVKATIDAAKHRKGFLRRQDFNLTLSGNPGTGKRTLATIYKELLVECRVWPGRVHHEKCSSFEFQDEKCIEYLEEYLKDQHGYSIFLFIDSIEVADPPLDRDFVRCLERHLPHIKCVTVLAGSTEGISAVLGGRPNGRWVFPRRLQLQDYDDEQLHTILLQLIHHNSFQVEGGESGLYTRIAARKVGRGRGFAGFANVHDLVLAFERMVRRQSVRCQKERINQPTSSGSDRDETAAEQEENDDIERPLLTKEDIIGPEPGDFHSHSVAWKELNKMVGMEDVKKDLSELLTRTKTNYSRELLGKEPLQRSLNRVFIGPPGTGKTTVARLYGQVLADMGLLSSGEVVSKTPHDFIGQDIRETVMKTSQILDDTLGKVLIIDGVHRFYGEKKAYTTTDHYHLACIDTIVTRISNRPGENRCVLLLGYPDTMEEMFKVNPGLRRLFPPHDAFRFQDYDDESLIRILQAKMDKEHISAAPLALDAAVEVLRGARDSPNFGNGGDIDNLLNQAKARFTNPIEGQRNVDTKTPDVALQTPTTTDPSIIKQEEASAMLKPCDFDPNCDQAVLTGLTRFQSRFNNFVGFETIKAQFKDYVRTAASLRRSGKDPHDAMPFTFVFRGSPGAGNIFTARALGDVFLSMGLLRSREVIECFSRDLISSYMGLARENVSDLFDRALDKVLFIDATYRSADAYRYEKEAVEVLARFVRNGRDLGTLVIVVTGYESEMDRLMRMHVGLKDCFTTNVVIPEVPRIELV
jgi:Holliday junction resolvasome RuvABC ATP-dependent DNA helicase subunit